MLLAFQKHQQVHTQYLDEEQAFKNITSTIFMLLCGYAFNAPGIIKLTNLG